jgi:Tfp pilus assembly protein PilN
MIKVNLLQNTVERTSVDVVETAISSRGTQQFLLLLIALGACVAASVADYFITVRENARVKDEVKVEEQRAAQLQDLTRQATELQTKNKAVEDRINAIQRLRAEQIGPVRLLQVVDSRLPADKDFRLKSIKQENEAVIAINGYSPSEAQVTAFAKNLEFSNGLFTNFNVETRRQPNPEPVGRLVSPDRPEGQVVEFVVKCSYNPQTLLTHVAETKEADPPAAPAPAAAKK